MYSAPELSTTSFGAEGISSIINGQAGFVGSNRYGAVLIGNTSGGLPIMFGLNSSTTGGHISYITSTGAYTVSSDANLKHSLRKKCNYQD